MSHRMAYNGIYDFEVCEYIHTQNSKWLFVNDVEF